MSGFHVHNNYSHCHALYPMLVSSYYKFFIIVLYSIVEAVLNSFAAFQTFSFVLINFDYFNLIMNYKMKKLLAELSSQIEPSCT